MRRILLKILLGISLAFSAATLAFLFFFDGYRDITVGRFHREAFALFSEIDDVYEARIYLIMGEGKPDGTFPIRPYHRDEPTYGSVTLKGEDLKNFLRIWERQEVSYGNQAMCHGPVYGFRLYRKGRLARETSICWDCNNFYVTTYPGQSGWYGFNSESKHAKALLAYCDGLLPYKRWEGE